MIAFCSCLRLPLTIMEKDHYELLYYSSLRTYLLRSYTRMLCVYTKKYCNLF